jgi:hypothetical protein
MITDSIDSRLSRRSARNATPDKGCVNGSPFFARFTWMRALAKSMLSHFRVHTSTGRQWRDGCVHQNTATASRRRPTVIRSGAFFWTRF